MEGATDWGFRRKGAFNDNLIATERLLEVGIAPRWQLFITKRGLDDLEEFMQLIHKMDLLKRCSSIGQKFEVFINGFSPEGNGYNLTDVQIEEGDEALIPHALIDICRDGSEMLGQPEYLLLESLLHDDSSPNTSANMHSISVNADYDVYPNIAEPTEWWRLGNLKADGIDAIIEAYRDETTPGMEMNSKISIRELAQKYGDKNSKKLYDKSDLICRFMHQWSVNYMEGKKNV